MQILLMRGDPSQIQSDGESAGHATSAINCAPNAMERAHVLIASVRLSLTLNV